MTNAELIERLQAFPPNQPAYIEITGENDRTWHPILTVEPFNIPREGNVINIVPMVKS